MTPRSRLATSAAMLLAVLLGLGAALYFRHSAPPLELATGSYLSPRRALPDFSLIDQHGRAFGPKNLLGHWSMMFFGYTNCPDFCPTTLTQLSEMEKHLRASGASVRPQVIFVSVDAKRDTPAQLGKYVPYFDPEFLGVTAADQATIEQFARKLGVAVVLLPPNADGSYIVDHSGAIFVLDPAGKLTAILTGPFTPPALQTDFQHIVSAAG